MSGLFQDYKSQKIMTYSTITYSLLTRIQHQKSTDIKLLKQCLVSQLYTNYITKKYFINGLLFQDHILIFRDF